MGHGIGHLQSTVPQMLLFHNNYCNQSIKFNFCAVESGVLDRVYGFTESIMEFPKLLTGEGLVSMQGELYLNINIFNF